MRTRYLEAPFCGSSPTSPDAAVKPMSGTSMATPHAAAAAALVQPFSILCNLRSFALTFVNILFPADHL